MNATTTHLRPLAGRRVRIDDGRWVSIRPIERFDGPGLSDFYARLSSESQRRRFLGTPPALDAPHMAVYTAHPGDGVVGVLAERGPDDGAIVAHASVLAGGGEGGAEVAFAVADAFQGRGIGKALVQEALELARRRGLSRVIATLLTANVPMRRLLRTSGCRVVADELDAGVEEISLELQPAA